MQQRILIIDDEQFLCISLQEGLRDLGYGVEIAFSGEEGLNKLPKFKPHVVFLDMRLPDQSGLEVIKKIKSQEPEIEVVMMTAYGNIKTAVEAVKSGAFDYINKPFDLDEIQMIIHKIFKGLEMQKRLYVLEKEAASEKRFMIGEHPSMKEVYEKIQLLAQNDAVTVLIRGETGTGKEVVASSIHENSRRKDQPMLRINCGAIPQHLVESEWFGFEKNAFTGAGARKKGLFEIADGGTVFLDEIGEVSLDIQTKLLRFLEERKFKRIGGLEDIEVDIRVIAATNKDLEKAVENKEFRQDLYYRLNVVPIYLPPLRDRGEDILLLAHHFLDQFNQKFLKSIQGFTDEAKEKLLNYRWNGNVRELKNVMERAVILYNVPYLDVGHLPIEISKPSEGTQNNDGTKGSRQEDVLMEGFSLERETQQMEKAYIQKALQLSEGNHSKAAQLLGISRFALKRKLEKYFEI